MRVCHVAAFFHGIVLIIACATATAEPARPRILLVVLPASSSSQTALESQLAEAVSGAGLEPVIASAQDISFSPEHLQDLERLTAEAEQHELSLELEEASARRREIVELLERAGATATHPERLAAALSKLAATAVGNDRHDVAIRHWRRALALQADLELDASFSPSVREVFQEARRLGPTLPPRPGPETLERLCDELSVEAVLWVAVGYDEGDLTVLRMLHRRSEPMAEEVRHSLADADLAGDLVLPPSIVERLTEAVSALAPPRDRGGPEPSPPPAPRPWYRRWWFYVTVGAVVAGAATATGLAVGLGDRRVDTVVHVP